MQLFELVSPRLFRPLAGPNRAFYAELLLLLWEECRHTADYSILRAEAVSRAEDYFAALAKPLALDADDAGDEERLCYFDVQKYPKDGLNCGERFKITVHGQSILELVPESAE